MILRKSMNLVKFFFKYACEDSDFNLLKTRTKYKARYKFDLGIVLGGVTTYKARYKVDLEIALGYATILKFDDSSATCNGTSESNSQSDKPREDLSQKKNLRLKNNLKLETFKVNEFLQHLKDLKHALIKLTTDLPWSQRDIDDLKIQPSDNDTSVFNLINGVAAFGVTEDDTDNNFFRFHL